MSTRAVESDIRSVEQVSKITIVGAGTMGQGIAQVFVANGFGVVLVDTNDVTRNLARENIRDGLHRWMSKGLLVGTELDQAIQRLELEESLEAVRDVQLAIEAVNENRDVKQAVVRELDKVLPPDAIICSNTSSISITELAAVTERPESFVGMHFMNPVPVMELVEVIRGERTSDEAASLVVELSKAVGKTPVTVEDYPGFVSNRILMPMLNEAFFCVMENVASKPDIDTVMKLGMRHPMGPLELADLIGLDVCLGILEVLHRDLGDPRYRPCPLLRRMVAAGLLGRKSGRGFHEY